MKKTFLGERNSLQRELSGAGILYPISKKRLLQKMGGRMIQVDFDRRIPAEDILEKLEPERFENAAALHCAYLSMKTAEAIENVLRGKECK